MRLEIPNCGVVAFFTCLLVCFYKFSSLLFKSIFMPTKLGGFDVIKVDVQHILLVPLSVYTKELNM